MHYEQTEKEEKITAEKTVVGNVYRFSDKTGSDDLLRIFVKNSILEMLNNHIPFVLLSEDNRAYPIGSFVTMKPETQLTLLGEANVSLK